MGDIFITPEGDKKCIQILVRKPEEKELYVRSRHS
jgi:hypothetical protein